MDRELACEIVKDLLPLYVDGMVSDVSKRGIEQHLEHCTDCSENYQSMIFHLEKDAQPSEVGDVKRFLNKTKRMFFFYGLCGLSLIAILVCMIVDLALNKGTTWSLIVGTAVLFADVLIYALLASRKNKGCFVMSVISVGTFCLLSVIQITVYYLMDAGTFWIFRYGFPIMLSWLGIVWLPVAARTFFKWNIWNCIALFLLLSIIGNYITRLITGDYVWDDISSIRYFMGNAFGELIGAMVFGIIGRMNKRRE
ncbi:zf-HC2 domain-containing protein [Parablautia muri]|uniref:Zf-HC2 domain-containing protein n=1 Tax=Parablautia muri TaxID=2320879 RepID=A0A9X5GS35_9FIRM|nr:zf-HC2 domain-containing protein [Parablautia muri]NBJ92889.1 zf-HC2 domain-containing protein [Parablautia muri]